MSPHRVVALGASNLTRGFRTVVAAAREAWGPDVEVLAALGHGRSYGGESRFLGRVRPGILQSGLWSELARRPEWYGFDPIHVRRRKWRTAWCEILLGEDAARAPAPEPATRAAALAETVRLYAMAPERSRVLGRERRVEQSGRALPSGGRVWLY